MRGSLLLIQLLNIERGIIPAHAGLTMHDTNTDARSWDHPRACGAHSILLIVMSVLAGSSPRMRGSPCQQYFRHFCIGIIPAHAGLTETPKEN